MSDIHVENLTKEFGDVTAVNAVDFEIQDGEFVVLVGPSGCGKSTTLRLLAGLERATDGQIMMGGEDVTDRAPAARDVAMVFQNYALYPHMTARRNISFGLNDGEGTPVENVDEKIDEVARMLDIADLLDRKPGELSGGEKQRVAIGRALVREPKLLLMDEPLSNLDAKLRIQMRAELSQLHDEIQTTTVYVTHDQAEAMTLGDRVVVLNDGKIQQVDPPRTLYDLPTNRFVAEFIGSPAMNTLEVTVDGTDAVADGLSICLPGFDASNVDAGLLGIRPEDIVVDGSASGQIDVEVLAVETLGNRNLIHGSVAGQLLTVETHVDATFDPGETVAASVDPDRLHLFDAASGEAVYHAATPGDRQPTGRQQS
ncbi:MAG: ABC transporter ATP-binding protein [Halorhabdus sp.]